MLVLFLALTMSTIMGAAAIYATLNDQSEDRFFNEEI